MKPIFSPLNPTYREFSSENTLMIMNNLVAIFLINFCNGIICVKSYSPIISMFAMGFISITTMFGINIVMTYHTVDIRDSINGFCSDKKNGMTYCYVVMTLSIFFSLFAIICEICNSMDKSVIWDGYSITFMDPPMLIGSVILFIIVVFSIMTTLPAEITGKNK